jgi:hypothetical protein
MFIENNNIPIRRSERIHKKYNHNRNIIIGIFNNEMNLLEKYYVGKEKVRHYNNICKLFIHYNHILVYNKYNIRNEIHYDKDMRDMLISLKRSKNDFTNELIVNYGISKKEEDETIHIFNKTTKFIEKYLNKKTKPLYKTILNNDVIGYIISFL